MIQAEIRAVQVQSVYWIPERHYVAVVRCSVLTVAIVVVVVALVYLFDWAD